MVKRISRREFLKGTAVGAAGIAASNALVGCTASQSTPTPCPTCPPCPTPVTGTAPAQAEEKASFELPPAAIPESSIKETVAADIVVVGAGIGGMAATASAAETGAKVVLLEKMPTFTVHGHHYGVLGSKLQKERGIEIDANEVVTTLMSWAGNKPEQRLIKLWADKSGEVMDWAIDLAQAAGAVVDIDTALVSTDPLDTNKQYLTPHMFDGWKNSLTPILEEYAKQKGADIRYETRAVQLIRQGSGRVTGVIAQTSDGDYIRFEAKKGVILCTGDYGSNPEMVKKLCPWAQYTTENWYGKHNTGDGHMMALWVGAVMDDLPHCTMIHPSPRVVGFPSDIMVPMYASAFLDVNILGERYVNEDQLLPYVVSARLYQPGHVSWQVWDNKWETDALKMGKGFGRLSQVTDAEREQMKKAIEAGALLVADTIEELAQKMQVPVETFKATVERYNELARMGKDLDFGKRPDRLTTVEQAPFYAVKRGSALLVTLGGLKVNTKLQVLDGENKVIPGLYAAGNVSGRFFANDYPMAVSGLSHGRALTFGRLAALNAVAE